MSVQNHSGTNVSMKSTYRLVLLGLIATATAWASDAKLEGKWQNKDTKEVMVFTTDGHVTSTAGGVAVKGTYECHGDVLTLKFEGDGAPPNIERKYRIERDTLKLEDPTDHQVTEMHRGSTRKE